MAIPKGKHDVDEGGVFDGKCDLKHLESLTGIPEGRLEQEVAENRPKLSGNVLTYALAFVAGTGFTLFGRVATLSILFV